MGRPLIVLVLATSECIVQNAARLPRLRLHGSGLSPLLAPRQGQAQMKVRPVEDIVSLPRRYERWPIGEPQANPRNVQRPFSGLRGDIALRLPTYVEDWRAGLAVKTVGAALFLYFACLAPVVAFGGALQLATQGSLGIIECIISRGVCGMAYAVLAGQPMTFIGPTGLTLTFTTALYAWTAPRGVPFLPMYAWVGLWTAGFLLTAACTNLAGLIRYCTRFTEEVFNSFLGSTYIWSATNSLLGQLRAAVFATAAGAVTAAQSSASALLSLVLAALTLGLCQASSDLSTSRYGTARARSLVADFGPACAVATVSALSASRVVRLLAEVPRLALPTGAVKLGRPLLVPLFSLPLKFRLLAALPAVFLAILFFLDQNITVRTVNSPVNKLLPRPTYHLDLAVLGMLTAATSLCGLPWMCAATVESINHVRSMTVYNKPAVTNDMVSPSELDERELADLRMMFDSLDEGKTGSISSDKLVSLLRSRSLGEGELLTTAEAARQAAGVLQRFDSSGDGKLQFDEFVSLCVASAEGEQITPDAKPAKDDDDGDAGESTVVETRLSGFLVHAMVLGTLSCVSRLRVVPIARGQVSKSGGTVPRVALARPPSDTAVAQPC